MHVELTPEPSEQERQAILDALMAEVSATEPLSPWRRAGLESPEDEEDYATAPPRQSPGARRA